MERNPNSITKYLVGGAVRDLIMGREPKDRDYVVIGETSKSMFLMGFDEVGRNFPVFLHPETREEYALARTERKTGATRHDFGFQTDGVTLLDDLERRDITINAMAMDDKGEIIDPFGGRKDIERKILRHVGPAFAEDPLRVLRLARFEAQTGFTIAPETITLAKKMVAAGELDTLTPERVAGEMLKALKTPHRSRFFTALDQMDALKKLFPEVHALKGQTQPVAHHAEGDAFIHTMMVIDACPPGDALLGFCALTHDLGKGLTPRNLLPHHYKIPVLQDGSIVEMSHEDAGAPLARALARRYRLPAEYELLAGKCAQLHTYVHRTKDMRPATFVRLFNENGGLSGLKDLATVARFAEVDYNGRISEHVAAHPDGGKKNTEFFLAIMNAIGAVRVSQFATSDQIKAMPTETLKQKLNEARVVAAKAAIQTNLGPAKRKSASIGI